MQRTRLWRAAALPITKSFVAAALISGRVSDTRMDDCFYCSEIVSEKSEACKQFVMTRAAAREAHSAAIAAKNVTAGSTLPSLFSGSLAAFTTMFPGVVVAGPDATPTPKSGTAVSGLLSPDAAAAANVEISVSESAAGVFTLSSSGRRPQATLRAAPESNATLPIAVVAPVVSGPHSGEWGVFVIDVPFTADRASEYSERGVPCLRSVNIPNGGIPAKPVLLGAAVKDDTVRALTKTRITFVAEAVSLLDNLLLVVAEHARNTFEFGSVLATRQGVQRDISVLAASVFAFEAAGLLLSAVDSQSSEACNAASEDAALLASCCRSALMLHTADAVDVLSPGLVFGLSGRSSPSCRYVHAAFRQCDCVSRILGPVDSVAGALLQGSINPPPPPTPSLVAAFKGGKMSVAMERAASQFRVPPNLSTATLRLNEDLDATRLLLAHAGPAALHTDAATAVAPLVSELFTSCCALFRAASVSDRDDEASGYSAALRATVFLDASAQRREEQLALVKATLSPPHQYIAKASVDNAACKLPVTPPSELPSIKGKAKDASNAGTAAPE